VIWKRDQKFPPKKVSKVFKCQLFCATTFSPTAELRP